MPTSVTAQDTELPGMPGSPWSGAREPWLFPSVAIGGGGHMVAQTPTAGTHPSAGQPGCTLGLSKEP